MTHMDDSGTLEPRPAEPDVKADNSADLPNFLDGEAARVAHAAAELGVAVPTAFRLVGVDEDGQYIAANSGSARDFRHGAAILARLGGRDIAECLAEMASPAGSGPEPEWLPPTDWSDNDALLAYLAKREGHPEWPRFYNGAGDWGVLLGGGVGIAAIAGAARMVLDQKIRSNLARYVVDQAIQQGVPIDPVEVIRAFNGSLPDLGRTTERTAGEATESGADGPPAGTG